MKSHGCQGVDLLAERGNGSPLFGGKQNPQSADSLETTAISEAPRILVVEHQSFGVQFGRQDNGLGFPYM